MIRTILFQEATSPVYGEVGVTIRFKVADLLWRSIGILVRFLAVDHPGRGTILLMSTDLNLESLEIIRIYGLRFKIEVSFKQSLRVLGAYTYHFWMAAGTPLRRVSGNQYLHHKSEPYRKAVRRKIAAYHRHIQLGLITQAGRIRPASDPLGDSPKVGLAILWILDSNRSPRPGSL